MLSLGRTDRERERERDRERDRITVKIRNMKRSSSRDSVPRVKRSRSSAPRYTDSSEERDRERDRDRDRDRDRLSPERLRRRRSPSPASRRYSPRREEYLRARDPPDRHYLYKVLCVSSLHPKASDEAVKDTLYREYKKFGDLSVKVSHEVDERVAYVYFRSSEDARDAKHAKPRIILFDKLALVEPVYERAPPDYRRGRSATPPEYERYAWSPTPAADRRRLLPEHERIYAMAAAPHPHPHAHPHPSAPALHRDFRPHEYALPTALHPHPHPHPHPHAHPLHRPPLHPHPHAHAHYLPRAYAPRPHHAPFDKPENKKDKFPNYLHHVQPEDDPLATRTLFAGNLEINISDEELRRIFGRYGIVEDIDIKRPQPGTGNAFAFVRYQTLDMAHRAKVELSGQYIGKFQCKIGYGKVTPTTRIWVGGLGPWTSVTQLEREFDRFGAIKKIEYVKGDTSGYILYDSIDAAQAAVKEMRGFPLGGADKRLRIDFADAAAPGNGAPASAPPYRKFAEPERDYDPPPWDESYALALRRSRPRPPRARGPEDEWRRGERRSGSAGSARRSDSDSDSGCGGARRAGALAAARTLPEVARKSDCSWCGALVLKNSLFPAKFHLTDGDPDIVESLMRDEDGKNQLRITQRLRLDQPKLDDVQKRISTCSSHAIFLGLAGSTASVAGEDSGIQTRPLRNLVSYLKQKEAAGVISLLNKETEATGVLYSFPPCNFSTELLKRTCHNLTEESLKDDHLVIVVVKGGTA